LTADTIDGYAHAVGPFLVGRETADGGLDLGGLSAADVVVFVVARCPVQSRGVAKMTVTALRSLPGFLPVRGLSGASLVGAVPSMAWWRRSGLLRALEPEKLLARLGTRAGEVAALMLDERQHALRGPLARDFTFAAPVRRRRSSEAAADDAHGEQRHAGRQRQHDAQQAAPGVDDRHADLSGRR
jgi:hypothetical protein